MSFRVMPIVGGKAGLTRQEAETYRQSLIELNGVKESDMWIVKVQDKEAAWLRAGYFMEIRPYIHAAPIAARDALYVKMQTRLPVYLAPSRLVAGHSWD